MSDFKEWAVVDAAKKMDEYQCENCSDKFWIYGRGQRRFCNSDCKYVYGLLNKSHTYSWEANPVKLKGGNRVKSTRRAKTDGHDETD